MAEVTAMSPVLETDPLMIAWKTYKSTEDFNNSKHWALRITPMIQGGLPDELRRSAECTIMPLEQREQHVEGSLWAAFMAGFRAARPAP